MKRILSVLIIMPLVLVTHAQKKAFLTPDIWLRADKFDKTLPYWADESGNSLNAKPANGYAPIADSLINFNKAIYFDGIDDEFQMPFPVSNASQLTVVTVYQSKGSLNERGVWNAKISETQDVNLTNQRITGPQTITRYSNGSMNFPVISTVAQFRGKTSTVAPDSKIVLGAGIIPASEILPFSGVVAEYLVFNRLLTGIELRMLQSYLAVKYGATLQYSDYLSSAGAITWNYEKYQSYSESIAGIGRDDNFNLYQKQSAVTDGTDFLVIAAGKLAATNALNTNALKNDHFLLWGNNGESTEPEQNSNSKYPLFQRKWLMAATGNTVSAIPTQIKLNTFNTSGKIKQCYLAIDRSASGNFSSSAIEYFTADSFSANGEVYFKNIEWDTDKSGSDLFTFSLEAEKTVPIKSVSSNEAQDTTGTSLFPIAYTYSLYPNPTFGEYNISLSLSGVSDVTVNVLDSQGKGLSKHLGKGFSNYTFNGHIQKSGIYFVEINSRFGKEIFKLIIAY